MSLQLYCIHYRPYMAEYKGSYNSYMKGANAICLENNDQSSTNNLANPVSLVIKSQNPITEFLYQYFALYNVLGKEWTKINWICTFPSRLLVLLKHYFQERMLSHPSNKHKIRIRCQNNNTITLTLKKKKTFSDLIADMLQEFDYRLCLVTNNHQFQLSLFVWFMTTSFGPTAFSYMYTVIE